MLAADPGADKEDLAPDVTLLSQEELLSEADLLTIHVNLNEKNRGFFGAEAIRQMKAGGWLINTSRGELIDEQALLTALETGRLSGAAVDVLQDEHMLLDHPNPLISRCRTSKPHYYSSHWRLHYRVHAENRAFYGGETAAFAPG